MMRYFLEVDIGATKSHALIADQDGRAVGFGQGASGNYKVVGWDGLRERLHAITDQALGWAGVAREQVAGAGFGVASYDWPAEREPTEQVIDSLGLSGPYGLVNDTIVGLLAGATEGWGVVVVAGTSNNCRGRDQQGREGWITGCGPRFAEYGAASELVAKAVQEVSLAWSKRGPATLLTEAFIELTGAAGVIDLLEGLALERYRLSASDAPLIFQVAAEGDEVAQEIIHWSGSWSSTEGHCGRCYRGNPAAGNAARFRTFFSNRGAQGLARQRNRPHRQIGKRRIYPFVESHI